MSIFFHEQLYRSEALMSKLRDYPIAICGAGSLGANLTESLARAGCGNLKVIDRDRIEDRNLSTQPYYRSDIGAFKAKILANQIYRAIGTKITAETQSLSTTNAAQLLNHISLIVDVFDNSPSRQAVKDYADHSGIPCLHAGLAAEYAEIIWNQVYRVPSTANDDLCDYPLARNLVLLTVAIACETIISHIATGERRNFSVTLQDLSVQPLHL